MASAKTAEQLVKATRDLVGVYARDKLGDGFTRDDGAALRTILPQVNRAITEILSTGIIKCRFELPATKGVQEYRLDPGCGLVEYVKYRGRVLRKTSLAALNIDRANWNGGAVPTAWGPGGITIRQGTPDAWYNDISDVIGLWPAPSLTDISTPPVPLTDAYPSIEILAEALADDLVNPSDIPSRIPSQFHDDIPVGAARWLLIGMIGGVDTDHDGAEVTDPETTGGDRLALKLGELSKYWGTQDDIGTASTVLGRIKRFANQRDESETVQIPVHRGMNPYGRGYGGENIVGGRY